MNARRTGMIMIALLTTQLVAGCATWWDKEELPANRSVRVVTFPVRQLKFRNARCTQELKQMNLSGSLQNISYSPISNVRVRAEVFFAGEFSSESFHLLLNPPVLQPMQTGNFSLTGTVHRTISHVELHAQWEPFFPPGL